MKCESLTPRNGRSLQVVIVARISTLHQDEKSLDDQVALCKRYVSEHFKGSVDYRVIESQISGERLDRQELYDLEEMIASRKYDLVIAEDLSRISRRSRSFVFCEQCEDADTRLIALNDHVDTVDESWRTHAYFGAMRHEAYNRDTGKRIRRSIRNRFLEGTKIGHLPFYCERPPTATTIKDVKRRPEMVEIVEQIVCKLEAGVSLSEVADWLNDRKIPKGTRGKGASWKAGDVGNFVRNPILKGLQAWNLKMSRRINSTGAHRNVPAPRSEHLHREVPHLACIDADRYDHLIQSLYERNARFRPGERDDESRRSLPRKRTRWPGQHVICGVCGHPYVLGNNGQRDGLMCYGAKNYMCWNTAGISRPLAASKILDALFLQLEKIPDFDDRLVNVAREEASRLVEDRTVKRRDLENELLKLEASATKLVKAIEELPDSPSLLQRLAQVDRERTAIDLELRSLHRPVPQTLQLPNVEDLRQKFRTEANSMATESSEFGRLMRKVVPDEIVILPYRAVLGNVVVCRAHFNVSLAALLPADWQIPFTENSLAGSLTVEVDDRSQRYAHALAVGRMRDDNRPYADIGKELNITETAAQKAMQVYRAMFAAGVNDPFVPMTEPIEGDKRMRRHLHPRYRFTPKKSWVNSMLKAS